MSNIGLLKDILKKEKLDGLLVSNPANVSYLSGFSGDESYLLITQKKAIFITDFRYEQQAAKEAKGFSVELVGKLNHFDLITGLIRKNNLKRVGFEARHITYAEVGKIRDNLTKQEFLPVCGIVENLRAVKSQEEIKKIRKATEICLSVFNDVAFKIKPGLREKELAGFVEYQMRLKGAEGASFDIIVLSGKNSTMPHGRPSDRKIGCNEAVLIDAGASFSGYKSDLTRMFFLGKIPDTIQKVYGIVKTAQEMALKAIRPGAFASVIDAIARDYIKSKGYGEYFGHSLGHGVGREVHEAPSISSKSKDILRPGMVFTVEPAIYLPNIGGIRIEDMVLVTQKGSEVLSQ
jgi:Xaa-Pro aminopeptidase